jgi:hypothetical protein
MTCADVPKHAPSPVYAMVLALFQTPVEVVYRVHSKHKKLAVGKMRMRSGLWKSTSNRP